MRRKSLSNVPELEKERLRRELARLRHRLERHVDKLSSLAAGVAATAQVGGEATRADWRDYVRRHPQWCLLGAFAVGWVAALPLGQRYLANVLLGVLAQLMRPWLEKLVGAVQTAAAKSTPGEPPRVE